MEVFKGKFDDAQRRIRVLKEKLAMARATIMSLEEAKNPRGQGEEWSLERVAGGGNRACGGKGVSFRVRCS